MTSFNASAFFIKSYAYIIILLLCFTTTYKAQDVTVDFEGKVSNDDATLSEAIVQVLQNGKLLTAFKTNSEGNYNVYLPLGFDYIISISKSNYVQKYFSVSTKDIPANQENSKLPIIHADVDLFKYYEGVDYSLFNEPINKFYYNSKKSNFEYDKEYLKEKRAAMKLVKIAEKKAILLALQKNEKQQKRLKNNKSNTQKRNDLTEQKKVLDEKLEKENLLLKLIEEDEKPILKGNRNENDIKLNILAANKDVSKKIIDKKINDLVSKYKQGVTEEKQEGDGIIIIKRVVVREQEAWVYEKKIFNWGGVSYFRDKQRITASTFNLETSMIK
jgi:hypothetical protein